jgi:hypothetical protein
MFAIQAVFAVQPAWLQEVLNPYATDSQAQQLLAKLALASPDESGYSLDKGLITHKGLAKIQHCKQS